MLIFSINPETIRAKNSSRQMLANENRLLVIPQRRGYCIWRLPAVATGKRDPTANVSTVKDEI
jgi:hypothetical protein